MTSALLPKIIIFVSIGFGPFCTELKFFTVDEARHLVHESLPIETKQLPDLTLFFSREDEAGPPRCLTFDVLWANPGPGSVHLGFWSVDMRTGEVWDPVLHQRVTNAPPGKLQESLRRRLRVTKAEYDQPLSHCQSCDSSEAQAGEPLRVGGQVKEPRLIKRVNPKYPRIAWFARVEAELILEATIDERGQVRQVRPVHSHPLLEQAAIEAVRQWRYEPTLLNGKAVPVTITVTVPFKREAQMDVKGKLVHPLGNQASIEEMKSGGLFSIVPSPRIAFATLDKSLRSLQSQGIWFHLSSPSYEFCERLFYKITYGSLGIAPNVDSAIQPPVLDLDMDRLAEIVRSSGSVYAFAFMIPATVFITETGKICAISIRIAETGTISDTKMGSAYYGKISTALWETRVISPGRLGKQPIPTAITLFINTR